MGTYLGCGFSWFSKWPFHYKEGEKRLKGLFHMWAYKQLEETNFFYFSPHLCFPLLEFKSGFGISMFWNKWTGMEQLHVTRSWLPQADVTNSARAKLFTASWPPSPSTQSREIALPGPCMLQFNDRILQLMLQKQNLSLNGHLKGT